MPRRFHYPLLLVCCTALQLSAAQAAPRCTQFEEPAVVRRYVDLSDRVEVDVEIVRDHRRESFSAAKPGHTLYERTYKVGRVVCHRIPDLPAGG